MGKKGTVLEMKERRIGGDDSTWLELKMWLYCI